MTRIERTLILVITYLASTFGHGIEVQASQDCQLENSCLKITLSQQNEVLPFQDQEEDDTLLWQSFLQLDTVTYDILVAPEHTINASYTALQTMMHDVGLTSERPLNGSFFIPSVLLEAVSKHGHDISTTVACIVALAVGCMIAFSLHAIASSIDELSGQEGHSKLTEAASVARRCSALAPMVCMLFTAIRMEEHGHDGEPPAWVQNIMIVMTTGLVINWFTIIIQAGVVSGQEEQHISDFGGTEYDVHPRWKASFAGSSNWKGVFRFLQAMSILFTYGGSVVLFIFLFAMEDLRPSLMATTILAAVFMLVSFFVWYVMGRAVNESSVQAQLNGWSWRDAFLSARKASAKAPMIAVLFVILLQWAQVNGGVDAAPQKWAQACMLTLVGLVVLEVLIRIVIGIEGFRTSGRYGVFWRASAKLHTFQFLVEIAIGGFIVALICSALLYDRDSPVIDAEMILTASYFVTLGAESVVLFLTDVLGWSLPTFCDLLMSASMATQICPIISILFVALRMRAFQITDAQGVEQVWAKGIWYCVVVACCLQTLCCAVLPSFTRQYTEDRLATRTTTEDAYLDEHQPLFGAFSITCVRFMTLLGIHGGAILLIVAIFNINPHTASMGSETVSVDVVVDAMVFVAIALIAAIVLSSSATVGTIVKRAIESVDRTFIGVDITVGKAMLCLWRGHVRLRDIVVSNPDSRGQAFTSPYLAKVETVLLDIKMGALICRQQFIIEKLVVNGVDVIFEKEPGSSLVLGNSNINEVYEFVLGGVDDEDDAQKDSPQEDAKSQKEDVKQQDARQEDEKPEKSGCCPNLKESVTDVRELVQWLREAWHDLIFSGDLVVREIRIENVTAKLFYQGSPVLTGASKDMIFDDLTGHLRSKGLQAKYVMAFIISSILKSAMENKSIISNLGSGVSQACFSGVKKACASFPVVCTPRNTPQSAPKD